MPSVLAYHRPQSLEDAWALLSNPEHALLAGGTLIVPAVRRNPDAGATFIDLQALGLDTLGVDGDRLNLGAMARLGDLMVDARVPALLADLCRRELPSALRNAATIGGTVGAAGSVTAADSVLLAGLLVHDAAVGLHGAADRSLADYLDSRPVGIVTVVSMETEGAGTLAVTGRTPADVPIVAAVGRRTPSGIRLALTGVAATPVLVDPTDPTAGLEPPSDFRGSSDYRLHLASTLAARVVQELS
ncbi:MAG: FAD binding domain-containing protein [Actinomycetota bacterium]|nr:FAD binding domain-containing protein [Actinomycetota bacterium]